MRISREKSRQLDQIIEHLVKKNGEIYDVYRVKRDILPDESIDNIKELFTYLKDCQDILETTQDKSGKSFWASDTTRIFLKQGGFTQEFDDKNDQLKEQREIDRLERSKLWYESQNAKWIYRTYWLTVIAALIALILSVRDLICSLF